MADIIDRRPGGGGAGGSFTTFRDQGNNSYAMDSAALAYGWTGSTWSKLLVDGSGALVVTSSGGSGGGGVVTQGTTPWVTSISGTVTVAQGTSPWITSQSGTTTIGNTVNTSQQGTVTVVQGTSPWQTSISGSVPVTGTFFQATQPVSISGTVTVASHAVTQGTSPWIVQGGSVSISGTVATSQQGTVSVVQSTSPWLTSISGTITANAVPPTLTKGTQGSTGFSTQDLKDAGRQQVLVSWEDMAGTAGTESSLTAATFRTLNAASLASSSVYSVTAGKTLRIQQVNLHLKSTSTNELVGRFRIRQATSVANTSPVIFDALMSVPSATVAVLEGDQMSVPIPDGLEVAGSQQVAFTWQTTSNTATLSMGIVGYEY